MDVLFLSRHQFTATTLFPFLFVPLTLGLSIIVAVMETNPVGWRVWLYFLSFRYRGEHAGLALYEIVSATYHISAISKY